MGDDEEIEGFFKQPSGSLPRIEHLWAYVMDDPDDGNEGIIGVSFGRLMMPLIASDHVRCDEYHRYAERIAKQLGRPVRLVRFETRVEVEVIEP
jgi:hypothetical protein